jgi:hypothetical protein
MTSRKERALSLLRLGYSVIPVEQGQKRPLFAGWPNYVATEELISQWSERGSIGLLTANTPAVDLDIRDTQLSEEMEQFVRERFGNAPVRIGNAPKRQLVFTAGEPFRKLCEFGNVNGNRWN